MATETATIRVTRQTRDLLAAQARERNVSVAALLAEIARGQADADVWRRERDACRIDAGRRDVADEDDDWATTLADELA